MPGEAVTTDHYSTLIKRAVAFFSSECGGKKRALEATAEFLGIEPSRAFNFFYGRALSVSQAEAAAFAARQLSYLAREAARLEERAKAARAELESLQQALAAMTGDYGRSDYFDDLGAQDAD